MPHQQNLQFFVALIVVLGTLLVSVPVSAEPPLLTNLLVEPLSLTTESGLQTVNVSVTVSDQDGDLNSNKVKVILKFTDGTKKQKVVLEDAGGGLFSGQVDIDTATTQEISLKVKAKDFAKEKAVPLKTTVMVLPAGQTTDVVGDGPFEVATTNLDVDFDVAIHGSFGDFLQGGNDKYLDTLLTNPDDAFRFTVSVPNDPALYGSEAGGTVPYVAYVLYPTTPDNPRADHTLPGDVILPHMDGAGEAPLFADDATTYPALILSHGRGDDPINSKSFKIWASRFASHGYIVVALFHGDRRFPAATGNDLAQFQEFALRPLAVTTAIDTLLAHPQLSSHVNTDQIGGVGESFGGATMLALQGGRIIGPDVLSVRETTIDDRLKATVGLVPFLGDASNPFWGFMNQGSNTVVGPFMALSGVDDTTATWERTVAVMRGIPDTTDKLLIGFTGEVHQFTEPALDDAFTWALMFLRAFVEDDAESKATLDSTIDVAGSPMDFVRLGRSEDFP